MWYELLGKHLAVAPGLGLAAEAGMAIYKDILDRYETMTFCLPDGSINPYTMIPMVTELLVKNGLKGDGSVEHIAGIDVYPPDWFNPFDDLTGKLRKTENTRTVHWYAKSWMESEPAWKTHLKRVIRRLFGRDFLQKFRPLLKP